MGLGGIAKKKGTFLDEGALTPTGRKREGAFREEYIVTSPIVFESGAPGSGLIVWVPAGYVTDGYSMPGRLLQLFQPKHANFLLPAILHDWLYDLGLCPRDMADRMLLQAMREVGVAAWQRFIVYRAVRFGGAGGFGKPEVANMDLVRNHKNGGVSAAVLKHLKGE